MTENRTELDELRARIAKLPREEQLLLADEILEPDRIAAREKYRADLLVEYQEMLADEAARKSKKDLLSETTHVAG